MNNIDTKVFKNLVPGDIMLALAVT